jgi:hypothetical protein
MGALGLTVMLISFIMASGFAHIYGEGKEQKKRIVIYLSCYFAALLVLGVLIFYDEIDTWSILGGLIVLTIHVLLLENSNRS